MPVYKLTIPALPDTSEANLAARYGSVSEECISVSEQFLRIISKQTAGSMRAGIRYVFNPKKKWQLRTDIELFIISDKNNEDFIHELLISGPLAPLYVNGRNEIIPIVKTVTSCPLSDEFNFVSEIIRMEEALTSDERKHNNSSIYNNNYIPATYWTLFPFEIREDNRWMKLDQALSSCKHPAVIEIIVEPANLIQLREKHYEWITQLMKVNSYGNEPDPDNPTDMSIVEDSGYHDLRYKDYYAEELLREHETFHETLREPQMNFSIRCWSGNREELRLLTPIVAESCFVNGKYHMLFPNHKKQIELLKKHSASLAVATELINDYVWNLISENDPDSELLVFKAFSHIASVNELLSVFRLPVANPDSLPLTMQKQTEFRKDSREKKETEAVKNILVGDDSELTGGIPRKYGNDTASVFWDNSTYPIHTLDLELLKKHMFICGVPGSGKTTAVYNFLVQLYMHNIPFLVLESAKTEYRILKKLKYHTNPILKSLGESIRIYTPGNENVSPFRFNPMAIPEGITADEHMNNLLSSFQAGMDIPDDTPLPALLGKALEEVYDNYNPENPPYLSDLVVQVRKIMDSPQLGYDSQVKSNLKTAIEVRLSPLVSTKRSIGKIFSRDEISFDLEEAMHHPCIIEMDALSTEQSNILSLFLLTSMREWIKANRSSGSDLQHVIVLEEAHNVVGNIPDAADPGDSRKKAADYITRMLAELRALGEGMMIADQLPTAVANSVIKNTGTKLAHRLTSLDDREEIGYTMLLGPVELEDFVRLQPGESYFYTEGMYKPRRVRCINSNQFLGFVEDERYPPDNNALFELIAPDPWFSEALEMDSKKLLRDIEQTLSEFENTLSETESMLNNKTIKNDEFLKNFYDLKAIDSNIDMIKQDVNSLINKATQNLFRDSFITVISQIQKDTINTGFKTNKLMKECVMYLKSIKNAEQKSKHKKN
jgi:hypothetical protein